jgi:hypothetical protein
MKGLPATPRRGTEPAIERCGSSRQTRHFRAGIRVLLRPRADSSRGDADTPAGGCLRFVDFCDNHGSRFAAGSAASE